MVIVIHPALPPDLATFFWTLAALFLGWEWVPFDAAPVVVEVEAAVAPLESGSANVVGIVRSEGDGVVVLVVLFALGAVLLEMLTANDRPTTARTTTASVPPSTILERLSGSGDSLTNHCDHFLRCCTQSLTMRLPRRDVWPVLDFYGDPHRGPPHAAPR